MANFCGDLSMNEFAEEKLKEAINKAKNHLPSPPYILMPKWWVEEEMAAHPERFSVANDEDMTTTWCGYILYTYGVFK